MARINIKLTQLQKNNTVIDVQAVIALVDATLDAAAKDVVIDATEPTKTWDHKPVFKIKKGPWSREISTDDKIYAFVDEGTRPHTITPKVGKFLRFGVPFQPKTRPGTFVSGSGMRGNTVVYARSVKHPGTKPRAYMERLRRIWEETELPKRFDRAFQALT